VSEKHKVPSHHGAGETIGGPFPNETMRLLIDRASCRSFAEKKIPEDVLEMILEAGIHAPTGGNLQPYSIVRIEDPEKKRQLARLCGEQSFIATAPVDLMFCIDWYRSKRWAKLEVAPFTATHSFRHFWISFQDTVIAAQNICTAADAMGLGSVYVGTVLECFPEIGAMLELPDGVFPVVLLSLGYPKVRPQPRKKLGLNMIVHNEAYRKCEDRELLDAFNEKYPALRIQVTEDRLEQIAAVCRRVHGQEFAEKCLARIKENGYISFVQRYFGLHYMADIMPEGNDRYLKIMEEFGFNWFKEYTPVDNSAEQR